MDDTVDPLSLMLGFLDAGDSMYEHERDKEAEHRNGPANDPKTRVG